MSGPIVAHKWPTKSPRMDNGIFRPNHGPQAAQKKPTNGRIETKGRMITAGPSRGRFAVAQSQRCTPWKNFFYILLYFSEEITDKHRDVNGEILIPSNAEVHYCHEYLVKPLQVREREIKDFIMGYTTALHNKTAHTACGCEEKYNVSRQTAKQWAHIFLKDGYAVLSTFIEKMADESGISFEMEGELT